MCGQNSEGVNRHIILLCISSTYIQDKLTQYIISHPISSAHVSLSNQQDRGNTACDTRLEWQDHRSSTCVTVGDRVVKAASKQAATARSAAAQNLMTFSRAHTPQPKEPAAPATQEDVPAPTVPIHATGGEAPLTAERRTPTHTSTVQNQRPTNNNHVILFLFILP